MTTRDLSAGMLSGVAAGVVRPALFYEGVFVSAGVDTYLRLWSGVGAKEWNGSTWSGGGHLLGISMLEETADLKAVGFTVTLSGMPSSLVSLALTSIRQGKPGKLWLALFDANGDMIPSPYQLRGGKFDISVIEDDGDKCTIAMQYEDRLVDLERPRERRYTSADQQIDYPDDLGFEYVPGLQDTQFLWG